MAAKIGNAPDENMGTKAHFLDDGTILITVDKEVKEEIKPLTSNEGALKEFTIGNNMRDAISYV